MIEEPEAEPRRAKCRGCAKPIVWGTTDEGVRIPLDPRPPVYEVEGFYGGERGDPQLVRVRRHYKAYVSHFATCPKANWFSAGARKAEA